MQWPPAGSASLAPRHRQVPRSRARAGSACDLCRHGLPVAAAADDRRRRAEDENCVALYWYSSVSDAAKGCVPCEPPRSCKTVFAKVATSKKVAAGRTALGLASNAHLALNVSLCVLKLHRLRNIVGVATATHPRSTTPSSAGPQLDVSTVARPAASSPPRLRLHLTLHN